MGAVASVLSEYFDRLDVAEAFTGDDDPWFPELEHQPSEKPLCCVGVSAGLYQDIEDVSICCDCTTQPVLCAADCNQDFL